MTWFLLNMPLAVLFILAWTLIPLWLVSRHPDTPPGISGIAHKPAVTWRDRTSRYQSQTEPA